MEISRSTALGFIAGNGKATEKVYAEYKNLMFFVIASYVPNKSDCDEILSESFLKVMEHRCNLKGPGKLRRVDTSHIDLRQTHDLSLQEAGVQIRP